MIGDMSSDLSSVEKKEESLVSEAKSTSEAEMELCHDILGQSCPLEVDQDLHLSLQTHHHHIIWCSYHHVGGAKEETLVICNHHSPNHELGFGNKQAFSTGSSR